jgi:peptidoglycan/xylan/chitin deacetylase (PgdA/CDA1 family)
MFGSPVKERFMKLSVVIPAFNEEQNIHFCLDSFKKQDFAGDFEIIVVDNASTDNTAGIARGFGVKVITESRKGVVRARQAGANAALGDIIVQADADTIYPPDWLSKLDLYFQTHPKYVAVTGAYTYTKPPSWAPVEHGFRRLINSLGVLLFGRPLMVSGAAFGFRKEAYLKLGGYDQTWLNPDQWGIAQHLRRLGRIGYASRWLCITSPRRITGKSLARMVIDLFSHLLSAAVFVGKMTPKVARGRISILVKRPIKSATVTLVLGLTIIFAYGYAAPTSTVFGQSYSGTRSNDKLIALTFDDGPNEPYTSQILDILDNYGIKATFFTIGENVLRYPDVAKRIVADGDVIGNHTYSHNANHALTLQGESDITKAEQAIYSVVGVYPHLYRPPHGKKSPWEQAFCKTHGLAVIEWNISSNDQHRFLSFGKTDPQQYAKSIIDKADDRGGKGSIILLHDGYGTQHNSKLSDTSITVKSLPIIINTLMHQGYRFVTVPQLLNMPAYNAR